ncbi:MAG: hypothetical protein ACRERE_01790 [Candidatus Entotheonellia bacterium]
MNDIRALRPADGLDAADRPPVPQHHQRERRRRKTVTRILR